jgi:two-component system osmolarity sensor histidine kinase EnvZ
MNGAGRNRSRRAPFTARLLGPRLIKRWLPASLFGRTLLIFSLPVAIMQLAVGWVFFDNHWRAESTRLSDSLVGEISWIAEAYRADPSPAHQAAVQSSARRALGLMVAYQPNGTLPLVRPRGSVFTPFDYPLRDALSRRFGGRAWYDAHGGDGELDIRLKLPDGLLLVRAPRDRAFALRAYQFIAWLTGFTLLLTAVSLLFIRNQVRAIERLADAADAFGRGVDAPQFKPHGAREVRKAAVAFIAMKERIQRYIDQRTALLASVSHDLRTPLTRLKLELALAEPGGRTAEMKRDLAEMEHMIDEYLAFARGESGEAREARPLRALVEEVCAGAARAGAKIDIDADPALVVSVRPGAFKRALSNLIMNAAAHGGQVRVTVGLRAAGAVEIAVDDDGPGIAPERHEEAFRPFSRLDEARNQNEKGVGLGLAIARDAIRAHGGDIVLGRSPLGGLRATIRLPG